MAKDAKKGGKKSREDEMYLPEANQAGLDRYKPALPGLYALQHFKEDSDLRKSVLIESVQELYAGFGNDPDDPLVSAAIAKSLQRGDGSPSDDLLAVLSTYAQKQQGITKKMLLGDYFKAVLEEDSDLEIPKEAKSLINANKGKKVGDIDKESDKELYTVVRILENAYEQLVLSKALKKMTRKRTNSGLEQVLAQAA